MKTLSRTLTAAAVALALGVSLAATTQADAGPRGVIVKPLSGTDLGSSR